MHQVSRRCLMVFTTAVALVVVACRPSTVNPPSPGEQGHQDAGVPVDAGDPTDASPVLDSATPVDAAVPGTDAGARDSGGGSGVWDAGRNQAYPGAPPVIPHALTTCSPNCVMCHNAANAANAPPTPHPERRMCRQCHLPQQLVPLRVNNTFVP